MNYNHKYLKYKNKYLYLKNQVGGKLINYKKYSLKIDSPPITYSEIIMPILLSPFTNISVYIPSDIENTLRNIGAPTFQSIIKKCNKYYKENDFDLNRSFSLQEKGYIFDYPPFHIKGDKQEQLMIEMNIYDEIQDLQAALYYSEENNKKHFRNKEIIMEVNKTI